MEGSKRINTDSQPVRNKIHIADCTISDNSIAVRRNAESTYDRVSRFRSAPETAKANLLRRYLERKYKCVPRLSDLLQEALQPTLSNDHPQPSMNQLTEMIKGKINYAIRVNGVVHRCGREHLDSPGAAHVEGDAKSVYDDTKRTLLKRLLVTEMVKNIDQCRQMSSKAGGIAKLRTVLELMRVGRFNRAIDDIMEHWTYDDCTRILRDGMEVYLEQRNSEDKGDTAIQMQLATLVHDRVHERFFEQLEVDRSEAEKVISVCRSEIDTTDLLRGLPLTNEWKEGFYDPVYVNNWFFWMMEPFRLTEKVLVCENESSARRRDHVAYVVCYNNSYQTRQIMRKRVKGDSPSARQSRRVLDRDIETDRYPTSNVVVYQPPGNAQKPTCFLQTEDGPCCTMALFNFVANFGSSSTTKKIIGDINSDALEKASIESNMVLKSFHHYLLCNQRATDVAVEDVGDMVVDGNHVVLIVPFGDYVWELDGFDSSGPLCLGLIGADWTDMAQRRLEVWTHAAYKTGIHNDVHAVVREAREQNQKPGR